MTVLFQRNASHYMDKAHPCKSMNIFGDSRNKRESEFFQEMLPELGVDSTIDLANDQLAHGHAVPVFNSEMSVPDVSTDVLQVGSDGYITAQFHGQDLGCPTGILNYLSDQNSPKHSLPLVKNFSSTHESSHPH